MSTKKESQNNKSMLYRESEAQLSVDKDAALLGVLQEISGSLKRLEKHLISVPVDTFACEDLARPDSSSPSESTVEHKVTANSVGLPESFLVEQEVHRPRVHAYLVSSQELEWYKSAHWWPPVSFNHTQPTEIIKTYHSFGGGLRNKFPSTKSRVEWDYYKPVLNYHQWRTAIDDSSDERFRDSLCLPGTGKGRPNFDINSRSLRPFQNEFYVPYSGTPALDLMQRPHKSIEGTLMGLLGGLLTVPPDHRLDVIFQSHKMQKVIHRVGGIVSMHQMLLQLHAIGGLFEITDMDGHGHHYTYKFSKAIRPCDVEEWFLDVPYTKARMQYEGIGVEFLRQCLPWNRIVLIKGLSHMQPSHFSTECPWSYPARSNQKREQSEREPQVYELHTQCSLNGYELSGIGNVFHITWIKLQRYIGEVITPEHKAWKHKLLPMDPKMSIGTISASVEILPDMKSKWCTLLVLLPISIRHKFLTDIFGHGDYPTVHMVLVLILQIMLQVSDAWVEIATYLEELLIIEGDNIAAIEDYKFSQSQKLFEIINQVDELLPTVEDTQIQWAWFKNMNRFPSAIDVIFSTRAAWYKEQDETEKPYSDEVYQAALNKKLQECKDQLRRIDELDQRIRKSGERLRAIRERARSLRDGIFSLTSVKEARESRILAENVKILTYVTIFYLPLAFCTSMYDINNMFGTGIWGYSIITAVISLGTYAIVFGMIHPSIRLQKVYDFLINRWQRIKSIGAIDAVLKTVGIKTENDTTGHQEVTNHAVGQDSKKWFGLIRSYQKKRTEDHEMGIPVEVEQSLTRRKD